MAGGSIQGMNFAAVEAWGGQVKGARRGEVEALVNKIVSEAQALEWTGQDFEAFMTGPVGDLKTRLTTLLQAIDEVGTKAVTNANIQKTTSDAL